MEPSLLAGIAIYNEGGYHAAHDAWEHHWLALQSGTDDERFLHGLIQFTAAVYHARNGNWSGATGLAESGAAYLSDLPETYRGVNVGAVRRYLDALAADPERIERHSPLALTYEGDPIESTDLPFDATAVAASVLAEERGYEDTVIDRACEYARADLDDGKTASPFVTFLFDFVRDPEHRGTVYSRLSAHVERRSNRVDDVSGFFEKRE